MTGKHAIVVFRGGYHGRTFGTMAMTTSNRIYRQRFGPLIPGIHVSPFPYEYHGITTDMAMAELEQLFKDTLHEDDVAAFVIEAVLGEAKSYTDGCYTILGSWREKKVPD